MRAIPCSLRKANDFIEVYHRHNKRTARDGGKFAVAMADGPHVVGVAIVGNPLSASFMDGYTAEVLRVCVAPDAPRNSNSFLYGVCRRIWFEMGGRKIVTYTLTEESGASLRGAGWTLADMINGHDPKTWGRNQPWLKRSGQPVIAASKYRWECLNEKVTIEGAEWPAPVADMREGGLFAQQAGA